MVRRWQRDDLAANGLWYTMRALLRSWRRRSEPVELCARRFYYQPLRFRWHGLLHTVRRIERVWEQVSSQNARRYFQVHCSDNQTYTLFQDLRLGAWYVELS